MGQNNTKGFQENRVPQQRLFKLSYVVHKNVNETTDSSQLVDLSSLLENRYTNCEIITQFLYLKLREVGYNLKPYNIEHNNSSLNDILDEIKTKGFPINNNVYINDIKISKRCYEPKLNNIYYFLNRGNVLLAFIILDTELLTQLDLKTASTTLATDVVLVVGYDKDSIYLKTKWFDGTLKIDNKFLTNIRELWNISIKCFNGN
jgi:hypothetical protein